MIEAPFPASESERLATLECYRVLDTPPEQAFDDLTRLASRFCDTPIALVSLLDRERQWFKSKVGLSVCETSRGLAFCAHAILDPDALLVVRDATMDVRFADNPLVVGEPWVRFYAGAPLVSPSGHALGTLCVIDHVPRDLDEGQIETLRALARQVVSQLELRRACAELAEAVEQVQHANRELRDFAYVAAHDLQEPLRKIVSFSELLTDDLGEDLSANAAEDLGHITRASLRLQKLISDLLELSRTGTSELNVTDVDLALCAQNAIEATSIRIEETGAEVTLDDLPVTKGDETLLTQLFQNLISNALKFIGEERPRIRITCAREGEETIIGVQDNGIGIAEKHAEKIFSPFKRLHGRGVYEGTGIGLAITRKAVERHHGRIWVESALGTGSHFRFTFPALRSLTSPSRHACVTAVGRRAA